MAVNESRVDYTKLQTGELPDRIAARPDIIPYWNDKKGRFGNPDIGLYIAPATPDLSKEPIAEEVLSALTANPAKSFEWAKTWGKVVTAIGPSDLPKTTFYRATDKQRLSYHPLETSLIKQPAEFFGKENLEVGKGGFEILVNNSPTNIEGCLISIVHMIDQLIWERHCYLQGRNDSSPTANQYFYEIALSEVKDTGFNIRFVDEKKILEAGRKKASVRIYGSDACKTVPDVMGAADPVPRRLTDTPNKKSEISWQDIGRISAEKIEKEAQTPAVIFGITLGKEPHVGHLFLMTATEIVRAALDQKKSFCINNDTGPRVAQAIARFAIDENVTPKEAIRLWEQKRVTPEQIVSSYRNRDVNGVYAQVVDILTRGIHTPLAVNHERWERFLSQSGYNTIVVRSEAALTHNFSSLINTLNPTWFGSGFAYCRLGNGYVILEKGGQPSFLARTAEWGRSLRNEGHDGMVVVDSAIELQTSMKLLNALGIPSFQIPGVGISFEGNIASGTNGKSDTAESTYRKFCEGLSFNPHSENASRRFKNSVVHLIHTLPFVTPRWSDTCAESLYDFKNQDDVIRVLTKKAHLAEEFIKSLQENAHGENNPDVLPTKTVLDTISKRIPWKFDTVAHQALNFFKNPQTRSRKEEGNIIFETHKLVTNQEKEDQAIKLIAEAVLIGMNLKQAINYVCESFGSPLRYEKQKIDEFTNLKRMVEVIKEQGYSASEIPQHVLDYFRGQKFLITRPNPYYHLLNQPNIINDLSSEAINMTLIRAGYLL